MDDLLALLLRRLREVRERLGLEALPDNPQLRFADALDSMGLVEFVALVADDCATDAETVERAADRRFDTVAGLADTLRTAGLRPRPAVVPAAAAPAPAAAPAAWLAAVSAALPATLQSAAAVDALLGRPAGWLERHAGIRGRRLWAGADPLEAAAGAARACLERADVTAAEVGALLVTSEAPPRLAGLAAHLHARLGLPVRAVTLEVGGACTGLLAALWTARRLLPAAGAVLALAVEDHSRWLTARPGPAGEAAALFGDGAAACLLTAGRAGPEPRALLDVTLRADGGAGNLLQVCHVPEEGVRLEMDGLALAGRAVRILADAVLDVAGRHGLAPQRLGAVVIHGGNGRLPPLVARRLGLDPARVRSETAATGNLGAASLALAHAAAPPLPRAPLVWAAVGAGLVGGAALFVPEMTRDEWRRLVLQTAGGSTDPAFRRGEQGEVEEREPQS
jgi:3-oxoacyl-[acyl-carrier-protein] synthase-3